MDTRSLWNKSISWLLRLAVLCLFLVCAFALRVHANDGSLGMTPDGVYAVNHNDIVMVSETIRVKLKSRQVLCEFTFRNTGEEQDVLMGFPAVSTEAPEGFTTQEDLTIRNFKAWTQYGDINVFLRESSSKSLLGLEHFKRYKQWYCFYVHFGKNETKTVYHSYDLSFARISTGDLFTGYIIRTGSLWKGNIGHSRIIFDFEGMPKYCLENFEPFTGYRFEDNALVWENRDYEPDSNLNISYNYHRYSDEFLNDPEADEDFLQPYRDKAMLFNAPIELLYRFRPDYVRSYFRFITENPTVALYLKDVLKIDMDDCFADIPARKMETFDEFAKVIMRAINENDIPVLVRYYDSVYGETTIEECRQLMEGLALYRRCLKGELVGCEPGKDQETEYDTPNTAGKQYYMVSSAGIKRDIELKRFGSDGYTFKFDDPLLFYGPKVAAFADAYADALKNESVQFLYDHCIERGSPKLPYSDPGRDMLIVEKAEKILEKYRQTFNLESIVCKMTGKISEACSPSPMRMEFELSGWPGNSFQQRISHKFNVVYEFPMWGIEDSMWNEP